MPRLALQPDELEDVGKAEVADRAFERHPLPPRLVRAGTPLARGTHGQLHLLHRTETVRRQPHGQEHDRRRDGQPGRGQAPRDLRERHDAARHDEGQGRRTRPGGAPRRAASNYKYNYNGNKVMTTS